MSDITLDITESTTEVTLNIVRGSVTQVSGGEANTASNLGGTHHLFASKVGVDLQFKGINVATGIAISQDISGNFITIHNTIINFDDLSDVEAYSGNSLKSLRLNVGETALEFYTPDAGITTFLGLTDAPVSYSGETLKAVRVNAGETALEFYTPSAADSDNIQDAAGTTGLFTEETASRLVGHSANTGTSLIFEMFEGTGTPVSVFQVDGNGTLYNNSLESYKHITANRTVIIGSELASANISGVYNYLFGYRAGYAGTSGFANVMIGAWNAGALTSGQYNTCIGNYAGRSITSQDRNVCIGSSAGRYNVSSDMLFIDGTVAGRTNAATELTNSLIVGLFAATPADQYFRPNAKLCVNVAPLTNMVAGDAVLEGGSLILKEITTPTADANYGKIYTKSDNKIYFQDGAGSEHEIAFV